jgi:hypothetical protein
MDYELLLKGLENYWEVVGYALQASVLVFANGQEFESMNDNY